MSIMTRIGVLSSRKFAENVVHYRCSYSILTNLHSTQLFPRFQQRFISSDQEPKQKVEIPQAEAVAGKQLSQRARFKQAVRDYGATIIVFHVAISLTSLGISYIAVSNGVDATALLTHLGVSESVISSKVAVEGSTFVMAYAVHKLFAPVRIAITLSAAPFIVRYLRKINLIKPPK